MKRVKKLFPALLALALLTGCGGDYYTLETTLRLPTGDDISQTASPLPEASPAGAISAPAVVTEGREPTEKFDLPAEVVDIDEWRDHSSRRDDMPVGKLIELPEKEVALYGVKEYPTGGNVVWLRWGDALAEFDWNFVTPSGVPPQVWCFDADGDGQEEMVVTCYWGSGTGVSIEALHIVEKSADGVLTDYALPEELWGEQMFGLLDTAIVNDRLYGVLGEELVDITRRLPEGLALVDVRGLGTGSVASFSMKLYEDGGGSIRFGGSACLDADSYYYCYVAETSALVSYADGVFTLSNFHLNSMNN